MDLARTGGDDVILGGDEDSSGAPLPYQVGSSQHVLATDLGMTYAGRFVVLWTLFGLQALKPEH